MKSRREATRKPKAKESDSAFADRMYRKIKRQPALFSQDEMFEMEARFSTDPGGMARRGGMALLAMSGKEIISKAESDRESAVAFAMLLDLVDDYIPTLEGLLKMMNAAKARLILAVATREDMNEVIAQAEAGAVDSRH